MFKKIILGLISVIIISISSLMVFACNTKTNNSCTDVKPSYCSDNNNYSSGNFQYGQKEKCNLNNEKCFGYGNYGYGKEKNDNKENAKFHCTNKSNPTAKPSDDKTKGEDNTNGKDNTKGDTDGKNTSIPTTKSADPTESATKASDQTTTTSKPNADITSDPGGTLPKTGESSNISFIIFGLSLIVAAIGYMVVRKRFLLKTNK